MTTALDTQRGVAVVDIGAGTTDVAVFLDGALVRATALPVGGLHITTDLAQGLGVPLPEAERVKREYGDVLVRAEHAGAEVMVASGGGRPPRPCRRPDIVAIVEARATEILNAAAAVITRALMGETLNAGVLLCGGTARLRGMSELAQRQFQVPVREASPISLNPDQASALNDPACAVIVGLLAHVKPAGRSSLPPITGSSAHRAVFSA
jgi:cell division protein FtsA